MSYKTIAAIVTLSVLGLAWAAHPICVGDPTTVIVPHPDPTNCSRYYECLNGNATLMTCTPPLLYNDLIHSCDQPALVTCHAVPPPPPSGVCVGDPINVLVPHPDPADCASFYECYNGVATHWTCPSGQLYDDFLHSCNFDTAVVCHVFNSTTCPPDGIDYFPDTTDCTKFIECAFGIAYVMSCPPGLFFDEFTKHCVSPNTAHCGSICYGVLPGTVQLSPYPDDCSKFYECRGASLSVMDCPPGLYFDNSRKMCDWPAYSGCTGGGTGPPAPPSNSTNDPRCIGLTNDYLEDAVDCAKYIECREGESYEMSCPAGLLFDPLSKSCMDPSLTNCEGGGGPVIPPPSGPICGNPGQPPPDPRCPCDTLDPYRYLWPFPGDCTKFIDCWDGTYSVQSCDVGLYFNPTLLVCDYPYHAGCTKKRLFF